MGPSVLFDKSFLQMLNTSEAVFFDLLFSGVVCPIFFVEVLADLAKGIDAEAEKTVSSLSGKTPVMHSYLNISHTHLCLRELLGHQVNMDLRPTIPGGTPTINKGKVAIVNDTPAEMQAFDRWNRGDFDVVEREFAAEWRNQLGQMDNRRLSRDVLKILAVEALPKTHEEALGFAEEFLHVEGRNFQILAMAFSLLQLNAKFRDAVLRHWIETGRRPLHEHAPYTAYCFKVEVFFNLCLAKTLISPDRPSNRTDAAYLFYLPFAKIFVSNDNLHRRVAPMLLSTNQQFVNGGELKQDLAALVEHFEGKISETEHQTMGLFKLVTSPPDDDRFLTSRLWKQFNVRLKAPPKQRLDPQLNEKIRRMMADARKGIPVPPSRGASSDEADVLMLRRQIPLKRGKWHLLPTNVR